MVWVIGGGDKERNIEETRNELAVLEAWEIPLIYNIKSRYLKGQEYLKDLQLLKLNILKGQV